MSDKTPQPPVTNETPAEESSQEIAVKKPNFIVRSIHKIKQTPPKTAIAVVGGVGLVALGAALGRTTASTHVAIVHDDFEPEPILVIDESLESNDSQTA